MSRRNQRPGHQCSGQLSGWVRWWLGVNPWPLLIVATVYVLWEAWIYSKPEWAMYRVEFIGDFCSAVFWFALLLITGFILLWVREYYEKRSGVPSQVDVLLSRFFWRLLAIAAAAFLVLDFDLPLHIRFRLSRSDMDALADQAMADPTKARLLGKRWVGLYWVDQVQLIGKTVVLYLDRQRGDYGFARVPDARTDVVFNVPRLKDHPELGYLSDFPVTQEGGAAKARDPEGRRMTGDWFVVYGAYWHAKSGPG